MITYQEGYNYDHSAPGLKNETRSVPKTNTVSECDFAKSDRLLGEEPNASTLVLELWSFSRITRQLNGSSEKQKLRTQN